MTHKANIWGKGREIQMGNQKRNLMSVECKQAEEKYTHNRSILASPLSPYEKIVTKERFVIQRIIFLKNLLNYI